MHNFKVDKTKYIITVNKNDLISDVEYKPSVSFCIPTKNEELYLKNCLKSIFDQNYENIEIIVVDGYSTDRTANIAEEFGCNIYFDDISLAHARQVSIEKSSGDILAIWDADIVIPHKDWLKDAVKCFMLDEEISTVWPRHIAPPKGSWSQKCHSAHSGYIFRDRIKRNKGVFGGGNSLFRRGHVFSVGGFDTSYDFGEDMILAKRLKDAGYKVVLYSDPIIHDTLDSLVAIYKRSIWGSKAFKSKGLDFYQQTKFDILREQYCLGIKGMFIELSKGNLFWSLFPLIVAVKSLAYWKSILFAKK